MVSIGACSGCSDYWPDPLFRHVAVERLYERDYVRTPAGGQAPIDE